MGKKRSAPVNLLFTAVRRQSKKVKILLAATCAVVAVVALKLLVVDHTKFFIASGAIHFAGILVLLYKLTAQKTCSGLSLKTQELTATVLAARVCCSLLMGAVSIHTFLDLSILASTLWVIYKMRLKLKSTYIAELDSIPLYYLVVPAAILGILVRPHTNYVPISEFLWAFAIYLESVAVLPQLRMMQKIKMIEPFTAHYVFALGIARFLGCANWIIHVYDTAGAYLFYAGAGYAWIPMALLAELVQTFILADFCYYYVKSVVDGQHLVRLPSSV